MTKHSHCRLTRLTAADYAHNMSTAVTLPLADLYEADETAWLERMAKLCARKEYAKLDLKHLSEYLSDMAKRDRREVYSRLIVLLSHLLKWDFQPEKQTGSWRATNREQRIQLRQLLDSKALENHARKVLEDAYSDSRKLAADETETKLSKFPKHCPWDIDDLLSDD